jgi:hypothetical protein
MDNEKYVRDILKAFLKGGESMPVSSDWGRGYVQAMRVAREEIERLEKTFALKSD